MTRRTKIVATLGPASESTPTVLRQLIHGGCRCRCASTCQPRSHRGAPRAPLRCVRQDRRRDGSGCGRAGRPAWPEDPCRDAARMAGLLLAAGDRIVTLVGGDGPSDARNDHGRLRAACSRISPSGDRVIVGDGAITLEVDEPSMYRRAPSPSVRSGGIHPEAGPASISPARVSSSRRRRRTTSSSPRPPPRPRSTTSPCRSSGVDADVDAVRAVVGNSSSARRQDRDPCSARRSARRSSMRPTP